MILPSKVVDMQNSYSSPELFPRESLVCVYQEIVKKNFIASGFKSNSTLRAILKFINRKMNLKIVVSYRMKSNIAIKLNI